MVQVTADAAQLRDDPSGLIPPEWHGCLPVRARADEVSTFAAIGGYYEAIGVTSCGSVDATPDNRDAVIGKIAMRLEQGRF